MTSLFVSHSSSDQIATVRVRDRLHAEGVRALFVDFDPDTGIPAGRDWERELYVQIRKADAMVFLSSPASVASQWCFAEVALARLLNKPVFPVIVERDAWHPLLRDTEHIDLVGEGEDAFARLWTGLRRAGLDPHDSFAWDPNRLPYPGLGAFTEQDAAVFFGRETEIERLLDLLAPTLDGRGRFIAVVGPSGSGKSSLVRAGLLPRLARLPQQWLIVPCLVPGSRPVRHLARSLARTFEDRGTARQPSALAARLAGGVPVLIELIEELRDATTGEPPSVLLVVDQAEELVTRTGSAECAAFLDLLHGVVQAAVGVWVLATLRSEFLSSILQRPGAARAFDETLLVSAVDRARLFEIIERPADRAGLQLAPGLAGRMVEDAQGGDALPLLAYTLRLLAEQTGPDGRLTREAYETVGGVVGALRAEADRTTGLLVDRKLGELVMPTLTKLAMITGDGELIRRRIARPTLTEAEEHVVQAFIAARLLVSSQDVDGEAVVEVAHEALLRQWPPLRQAIEASGDELRLRAELERWVHDWERSGRQDSYLVSGERLDAALRWAAAHPNDLVRLPGASEFLARADRQQQVAIEHASTALADRALVELNRDSELGTLLAIAAVEEYGPSARATSALSAAVVADGAELLNLLHDGSVNGVVFSPDGTRIATASRDHTARMWHATSGAELLTLRNDEEMLGVAFSPDGTRIATAAGHGSARVWDISSGAELLTLRHHADTVLGVVFSPDGTQIATAASDDTTRVWDATSGAELLTLPHEAEIFDVAFSPDGTRIATAADHGSARVWDATSGAELLTLPHDDELVAGVAFSPDGTRIATAVSDRTARVWDATMGAELLTLRHENLVTAVTFSPDGARIATAELSPEDSPSGHTGLGGIARVWDTASGLQLLNLRHKGHVTKLAFSPDGTRIVTAGDNTARVWDVDLNMKTLLAKARSRVSRQLADHERFRFGLPVEGLALSRNSEVARERSGQLDGPLMTSPGYDA